MDTCTWVQLRMTEYVRHEHSVPHREREKIADHLESCPACKRHEAVEIELRGEGRE